MKQEQNVAAQVHPLESDEAEREWFLMACSNYVTAYRRAVLVLTGTLPTWAERQSAGRPQAIGTEHHEEIRDLLALGVAMSTVAPDSAVKGPNDPLIKQVARNFAEDSGFIQSIRRYAGEDLIWFGRWTAPSGASHEGGSNRTTAYKKVAELLQPFAFALDRPRASERGHRGI